jgi:hypothetical protein
MSTDQTSSTSRSAGGNFVHLLFGYFYLQEIAGGYSDGRRDETHSSEVILDFARRLSSSALASGFEADNVLSGRIGCPCCQTAEQSELGGPRHPIYVHAAALLLYRIAGVARELEQLTTADELDADTNAELWLDDELVAELLDDHQTRRFLDEQCWDEKYLDALPGIYAHVGLEWDEDRTG